jgi:hypothetical protein
MRAQALVSSALLWHAALTCQPVFQGICLLILLRIVYFLVSLTFRWRLCGDIPVRSITPLSPSLSLSLIVMGFASLPAMMLMVAVL